MIEVIWCTHCQQFRGHEITLTALGVLIQTCNKCHTKSEVDLTKAPKFAAKAEKPQAKPC